MKFISNHKGIKIEFEKDDTPEETRLAKATIEQLLCVMQIIYKPKGGENK